MTDQTWIFLAAGVITIFFTLRKWYATSSPDIGALAWAQSNKGFKITSEDRTMMLRFPRFHCLQQGTNQYAENIAEGEWCGMKLTAFDYHYTNLDNRKGDHKPVHRQFSAVILTSPVPLEPLYMRPETLRDKITEFIGIKDDDIDFESVEFSRKFYVTSPDKKWVYAVLHQRTIEFLLSQPMFSIQFDWNCAIAYREDKMLSTAEFQAAAEVLKGIFERLPDYLTQQQRQCYDMDKEKELVNER